MTRAGWLLGLAVALAAGLVIGACTQPPTGSLSVTPGPDATSSLLPPVDGTPAPSSVGGSPAPSASPGANGPSISGAPQISGLPLSSPPHDSASDAPAAS
jgi:hypothetical protein